jgi:hypothetical protein
MAYSFVRHNGCILLNITAWCPNGVHPTPLFFATRTTGSKHGTALIDGMSFPGKESWCLPTPVPPPPFSMSFFLSVSFSVLVSDTNTESVAAPYLLYLFLALHPFCPRMLALYKRRSRFPQLP